MIQKHGAGHQEIFARRVMTLFYSSLNFVNNMDCVVTNATNFRGNEKVAPCLFSVNLRLVREAISTPVTRETGRRLTQRVREHSYCSPESNKLLKTSGIDCATISRMQFVFRN